MTTADYLESLQDDLETIVTTLDLDEGTDFTDIATMTTQGEISKGGGDVSEYFNSTITPSGQRAYKGDWIRYIKKLPHIEQTLVSMPYLFYGFLGEEVDLSGYTNNNIDISQYMFYECTNLKTIIWGNFDFNSSLRSVKYMFYGCTALETADLFYTNNVTDFSHFYRMCTNLKNVPVYNTSKATNMSSMFSNCNSLTDTSIDNILQMCINATSYTGTKTLATLGFTSTMATASRIQGSTHYQDFTTAGWTIGY